MATSTPPEILVYFVTCLYLVFCSTLHSLYTTFVIEKVKESRQRFLTSFLRIRSRHLQASCGNVFPQRRPGPRIWMRERSQHWWDKFLSKPHLLSEKDWLENFRMTRESFEHLCKQVKHDMKPAQKTVRQPVPLKKRVAIAVYQLASSAEYQTVANLFGVHKTTVHRYLYNFCNAVTRNMINYIEMPSSEEAQALADATFHAKNFPQIWGTIDSLHIPITPPSFGYRDFINRKGWPSYVLQAVVDQTCLFRNISCKLPGSAHDATVLEESEIFKQQHLLPQGSHTFDGCSKPIPLMLAGNSGYPLLPWIMKGFVGTSLTAEQESFNAYLSSVHMIAESAFGRLKGRWRILLKKSEVNHSFMPTIVETCCILHNFCEKSKAKYFKAWDRIRLQYEQMCPQPRQHPAQAQLSDMRTLRDHITSFLASSFPLQKV